MTEIDHIVEKFTCDPLKYKMDNSIHSILTFKVKSIRMKIIIDVSLLFFRIFLSLFQIV